MDNLTNPPRQLYYGRSIGHDIKQVFECSEITIANFEPKQGSQEAGVPPTIIYQNDTISMYTTTVISIPLTNNQRRASVPPSVFIPGGED